MCYTQRQGFVNMTRPTACSGSFGMHYVLITATLRDCIRVPCLTAITLLPGPGRPVQDARFPSPPLSPLPVSNVRSWRTAVIATAATCFTMHVQRNEQCRVYVAREQVETVRTCRCRRRRRRGRLQNVEAELARCSRPRRRLQAKVRDCKMLKPSSAGRQQNVEAGLARKPGKLAFTPLGRRRTLMSVHLLSPISISGSRSRIRDDACTRSLANLDPLHPRQSIAYAFCAGVVRRRR